MGIGERFEFGKTGRIDPEPKVLAFSQREVSPNNMTAMFPLSVDYESAEIRDARGFCVADGCCEHWKLEEIANLANEAAALRQQLAAVTRERDEAKELIHVAHCYLDYWIDVVTEQTKPLNKHQLLVRMNDAVSVAFGHVYDPETEGVCNDEILRNLPTKEPTP